MTEKEFWTFLENAWAANGRESQFLMAGNANDPRVQKTVEYIKAHSLLPKDYNKVSKDKIIQMGGLLLDKNAGAKTKEAILIILAHHTSMEALDILKRYNTNPDGELKLFAEFALDECHMWHN